MAKTTLFHVTSISAQESILAQGFNPLSYWASDMEVLEYYRETVEDEDTEAVVFVVDLDELIQSVGEASLEADFPGIEEPICGAIGKSESQVFKEWRASSGGWRDSLNVIGSLRCREPIPASCIRLADLDDYLSEPSRSSERG